MTETAEKLKSELCQLSPGDRAELAHFLLHSLDDEADADAGSAWDAELEQRMKEIESGCELGQPAAEVFAELREKYP